MNSLNMDLGGMVVVVREGYRRVVPALQLEQPTQHRLFAVPASNPGEGAYRAASGHLLFGYWLENGKRGVVDARDLERAARTVDLEDVDVSLGCIYCGGSGRIGDFICTICEGTGLFTPLVPIEA